MHDDLGIYLTELLGDWMSGSFDEDDVDRLVGKVIAIVEAHAVRNKRSLADDPAAVERACIKQYGKREWCMWGYTTRDDARTDMQDVLRAAETGDTE